MSGKMQKNIQKENKNVEKIVGTCKRTKILWNAKVTAVRGTIQESILNFGGFNWKYDKFKHPNDNMVKFR